MGVSTLTRNRTGSWADAPHGVEDGERGKALRLNVHVRFRDEAVVHLPMSAPPPIEGRDAAFQWRAFALLDVKRNDLNHGWRELRVT
ncbi:hypothetical protein [Rubrivirga marina]|uniref:Uncharacterized protein n=1 Tax=Rubrivirga marina TaxID=1196024 RepID=A0A271J5D5_9BACT|nr:hypothetical protein [Rubrivirga marina]PAP78518.1 hypothetical protein BSZ37_19855 [Rubrivirga marina]